MVQSGPGSSIAFLFRLGALPGSINWMPQMKLTARQIDPAKPKEKSYKLADGGGMDLETFPNGAKSWRLKYRIAGKEKRV